MYDFYYWIKLFLKNIHFYLQYSVTNQVLKIVVCLD